MVQRFKPSVNKKVLILLSGIMWSGVGILLNWRVYTWLQKFENWQIVFTYSFGIIVGILITRFGFSKRAKINCDRIMKYPEKVCLFAFQRWQMYFLILIMMSIGLFLRRTTFISKQIIAPIYVSMGLTLFLSSFVYYKRYFKFKIHQSTQSEYFLD